MSEKAVDVALVTTVVLDFIAGLFCFYKKNKIISREKGDNKAIIAEAFINVVIISVAK